MANNIVLSHHADPAAIGTDPGGAVAESPFILRKTLRTDLKTAGAVPAERQLPAAAMADKIFAAPPPLAV